MKIVKIHGGLGNQMFQYSFALALSARGGEVRIDASALAGDALHNGYELSTVFAVTLAQAEPEDVRRLSIPPDGLVNRFRRKYLTKPTQVIDRVFGYQPEAPRAARGPLLRGLLAEREVLLGDRGAGQAGAFLQAAFKRAQRESLGRRPEAACERPRASRRLPALSKPGPMHAGLLREGCRCPAVLRERAPFPRILRGC